MVDPVRVSGVNTGRLGYGEALRATYLGWHVGLFHASNRIGHVDGLVVCEALGAVIADPMKFRSRWFKSA
jgi:hypothetical protein